MPMSATRAKSVIIVPTDATPYNSAQLVGGNTDVYDEEQSTADTRLYSNRSSLVGVIDNLTQFQFLIDDVLQPSRPIVVSKINGGKSISAGALIENEKALNQARIPVRSFVDYNRNFIIGRCYGLMDGVSNLQGKSQQLQLLYNETTAAGVDEPPVKNKMLNCFLYHIRKLVIRGDNMNVVF